MTPIGSRNSEWMVCPPTLSAATPVGAQMTICLLVFQFKWLSSVDLPVPARPVTNTCSRVPSMAWNTAACSRERVTFCTTVLSEELADAASRRRAASAPLRGRDPTVTPLRCAISGPGDIAGSICDPA
jgi:hypothetical protein